MREGASQAGAISRCKSGPGKAVAGPPGSECCVRRHAEHEAYTAVVWDVGLST
jgi:hypothetical protein